MQRAAGHLGCDGTGLLRISTTAHDRVPAAALVTERKLISEHRRYRRRREWRAAFVEEPELRQLSRDLAQRALTALWREVAELAGRSKNNQTN